MEERQASREINELDLPSRDLSQNFVEEAMNALFPISARRSKSHCAQEALLVQLETHLKLLLLPVKRTLKSLLMIYRRNL